MPARPCADIRAVAGYLIALIAFALPLGFGATGIGRPRLVIGLGGILACIWAFALVAGRAEEVRGNHVVPLWFLVALIALLSLIWCGGLWLGVRLRRARAR
jgi:hypothetical protein